jgi:aryl-alcohol dehydrogenase-like predicted oxidoreductase
MTAGKVEKPESERRRERDSVEEDRGRYDGRMRYVECGDIRCSVLGFGCGSVMGRVGRRDSLRAMKASWDAGITLFDTARSYGFGEAEGLLGEFLQGRREQATVVTKFGILPGRQRAWKRWAKPLIRGALRVAPELRELVRQGIMGEMSASHFDVRTLRASLETSLRELRTEYVDVLLAHEAPASAMQKEDLLAELAKVVEEGKARRVGVASTGMEVAKVAMSGPPLLSVLQYPALGINDWPEDFAPERMRIANHPFGGAVRATRVVKLLAAMAKDSRVEPALREKLQGDAAERMAEYWFARAMRGSGTDGQAAGPHAIVTSMLTPEHLRADVAAIASDRFSSNDVSVMERWINAHGLLE